MPYENIILDVDGRVATVTLNRPEAMNAATDDLYRELGDAIGRVDEDRQIACMILTGAGKAFCAGADLKLKRDHLSMDEVRARHRWILKTVLAPIYRMEKPVIAAVNGVATGGGCNLALACDIIVAGEHASFIQSFARVGLIPDLGGLWFLTRHVGLNVAKELCFTARKVGAAEAGELGLANHVVPHDELMAKARELAASIAKVSPKSNATAKALLNASSDLTLDQMLEMEAYAQSFALLGPDFKEGTAAFRDKREPDFYA